MRKFTPVKKELYHVFNRGTEKRNIFISQKDYQRFIVNLIMFNTQKFPLANISRYNLESAYQKTPSDPLVKIHAFSLLPNHFHLIIEQMENNGLSRFLHRIEMGYSRYFNKLYSRTGNLFQGAYRISHVNNDSYRLYLPLYIHLNPLDLLNSEKSWKEKGVSNKEKAIDFLKNYPWSSLGEYLKIRHFPFVSHDILDSLYESPREWEVALKDWLPEHTQVMCVCA